MTRWEWHELSRHGGNFGRLLGGGQPTAAATGGTTSPRPTLVCTQACSARGRNAHIHDSLRCCGEIHDRRYMVNSQQNIETKTN